MHRVTLSPPTLADIPAIAAPLQDREVSRWLSAVPWPYGLDDARAFVTKIATPQDLSIRVDGAFAGMIRTGPDLGYWVAPAWQGRGIGLRAGILALSRGFDGGADRVTASVMAGNDRSARLLARLGFQDDGPRRVDPPGPGRAYVLTAARFAAVHPIALQTDRTRMDPPTAADLGPLRAIATRPEVARMLFIFHDKMSVEAFAATHPLSPSARPFRLAVREDGRLVGSIGVGEGPQPPIYYFLDPSVAGRGLAFEIVAAFIAEVQDRFGLEALMAEVFDDNPASVRVLLKAGFRPLGPTLAASAGRDGPAPAQRFIYRRAWEAAVGPEGLEPPTKAL